MEQRLLIVEKLLHQRKILKRKLDAMLESKIAIWGQDDMLEVCRTFQPDCVVVYLNGMESEDEIELKKVLKEAGYLNENLILLGTEQECSRFKEQAEIDRCIEIKRPVGINKFVLSLKAILQCECREKIQIDLYKRNILLIDDNPVSLKVIKLWLEDTFNVSVVNSGTTALKFLEKKNIDLILMDYMMPEMDGIETLEKLRENPDTRDIPVFFLTSLTDNEKAVEVMKLKPQGYFLKTARKEEVVTAIASFLDML